eukprot:GDKI01011238.1.p2 GENE.GDKI01011238.1~~GDKI01011238.1.p2  ORF type:complete len:147 (+),score=54.17 GDKI01011238.1:41-442(+)
MVQRLTYRRKNRYNTRSNVVRVVKTPGGKNVYQNVEKVGTRPKCGDCKRVLAGIPAMRPFALKHLKHRERTVARPYGGSRCHECVRSRIVRAFLIEEQKCVKQVLQEKERAAKAEVTKAEKKSAKKGDKKSKK